MIKNLIKNNKILYYLYLFMSPVLDRLHFLDNRNNVICRKGLFFDLKVKILGSNNIFFLKKRAIIRNSKIEIFGNHCKLIIGEDTHIKDTHLIIQGNYSKIYISKNTTIESSHIASTENNNRIIIGTDCMFARNITIRNGDSHKIFDTNGVLINCGMPVIIGNHVWLGEGTVVLKGSVIGENCVVGTKSIVTTKIPQNSIVVGFNKLVKQNISWKR